MRFLLAWPGMKDLVRFYVYAVGFEGGEKLGHGGIGAEFVVAPALAEFVLGEDGKTFEARMAGAGGDANFFDERVWNDAAGVELADTIMEEEDAVGDDQCEEDPE